MDRIFSLAGLLSLTAGFALLMLVWLGVGVGGPGRVWEARGFAFLIIWPVTMLAVLLFGTLGLAAGGRGRLVVAYLVASLITFLAVDLFVTLFLLGAQPLLGVFFFAALNTAAIVLAQKLVL